MDHADIVNLVIFAGTALVTILIGFVAWLWRLGGRATTNEVRIEETEKRLDRMETYIMGSLQRIEAKLDTKVDR